MDQNNNPMFMRLLADALRQRTMSPQPSYDSMGRPVEQQPQTQMPSQPMTDPNTGEPVSNTIDDYVARRREALQPGY